MGNITINKIACRKTTVVLYLTSEYEREKILIVNA